jgi:antitoxin component YwqK of YwqJK toxin-antitoxin module
VVLRRTGLDELPLLVVIGASASLVAWATFGSRRSVEAVAVPSFVAASATAERDLVLSAASLTDGDAWADVARKLAQSAMPGSSGSPGASSDAPRSPSSLAPDSRSGDVTRIACADLQGRPIVYGWALDGRPHSRWVAWAPNGMRLFSGRFDLGVPEGAWTWWHDNGEVRGEGYFEAGLAQGLWREFHPSGHQASVVEYVNGRPDGPIDEWWDDGTPRTEGQFDSGERDGPWETWHENGQIRAQGLYRDGLREGLWHEWHDNGQSLLEATYQRGRPDGAWGEWYRDGRVKAQGYFVDGRREGIWVFTEFDGTADPRSGAYHLGHKVR